AWENNSWEPSVQNQRGSQNWEDEGSKQKSGIIPGWSRKKQKNDCTDKQDKQDWNAWNTQNEGWNVDGWQNSRSKKSKDSDDHNSRSRKARDVPPVLYPQAFISDIPVEFDENMVNNMHTQCGVARHDLPISVKFLPSKDKTGETCACITRYEKEETLEFVIKTMHGKQLSTRSGKHKTVGVKRARPARWMVKAGLARDEEPGQVQHEDAFKKKWPKQVNKENFDVVVAPKQLLDEWVEHEGTIIQWYPSQASGFLRTNDGVDLFAQSNWFLNLDDGEVPEIGRRVVFEVTWNRDKDRYHGRNICLVKPTEHFPSDLPDGPQLPLMITPEQYEPVEGLDYFCNIWNLTSATRRWLLKLTPEVQEKLINEFDDSFVPDPLDPSEEITLHVSSSVAVGGLHSNITEEVLWKLFSRFGKVQSCRFLGGTAVIEMEDEEEALLAVQDVMLSTDWPGALVAYFYHATPPLGLRELPEGQRIFGICKKWNRATGCGFITANGVGPDLPITSDTLEDVVTLMPGAPVLFMVERQYQSGFDHSVAVIDRCMGDRQAVRQQVSSTFGTDSAVRNWARQVLTTLRGIEDLDESHRCALLELLKSGQGASNSELKSSKVPTKRKRTAPKKDTAPAPQEVPVTPAASAAPAEAAEPGPVASPEDSDVELTFDDPPPKGRVPLGPLDLDESE
ncbi:unnamed protein product, partial [Cladocopium goreaui]